MDTTTVLIGSGRLAIGLFTNYARFKKTFLLGKLEHMQNLFDKRLGNIIHINAYTFAPILAGGIFISSSLKATPYTNCSVYRRKPSINLDATNAHHLYVNGYASSTKVRF